MKENQPQLHVEHATSISQLIGWHIYAAGKRLLDIAGSTMMLFILWPLLLGCMIWIKMVDGGPIFYKQWRVGKNGWLFRIYKFRTMSMNAESGGATLAQENDPRVLRGCQWMRKSHVDELPQLFNIFVGNMSLVGPRPERPEIFEELHSDLPGFQRRLQAKPGLTGLAQVCNGYSNDLEGMRKKLAYDLRYIRQRTVFGDMKLILLTIPKFWDSTAC
ncbi:sugar transferase [Planctomycetota bacterium]|nr:sugar transferase [Planctomycetota bacterium]